ncbi:hypothetical protein HHK36_023463 [Tetracentron sinense]|uniref:HVA22-like protein n=1 Tax=Tetracentron sinense TaxID=13715 RepID=A0A834YSE4_TETSI|nr:hypothetical protein HHK36_023463 [Tetracentron sinense]
MFFIISLAIADSIKRKHKNSVATWTFLIGAMARSDATLSFVCAYMRAIESPSTVDNQQWLTYWVIYSFITLFELSCWKILAW